MLECQKHLFDLEPEVTYLNCAYMSPLMHSVRDAGINGILRKTNPHQILLEDFFYPVDELRKEFATLINAEHYDRIALIPSVSYGMSVVANNISLNPGQKIILLQEQFPSNYFNWEKLVGNSGGKIEIISAPDSWTDRAAQWNEWILSAIDDQTRVVALPQVHWSDGTRFDLKAIREKTREVGALLIIDGTQSVGAMPFDITEIQPDALIVGGYKWMMGPYSLGLAYFGEYFDSGDPIEENWINRLGSEDFSSLAKYESRYKPMAHRFNVGEHSNFILVPMLLEAVKALREWQPERIQQYCRMIGEKPLEKMRRAGISVAGSPHLLGLKVPPEQDISALQMVLKEEKIFISVRGRSLRISPNIYNSEDDLMKLAEVVELEFRKVRK